MSAGCGDLAQSFEAKQERRRKARPRKKSKKEKRINRAEHFSPLSSSIHLSGKQTWHFRQKHLWADSLDSSSRSTFCSSSSFNLPQTRIASLSCPEGRISRHRRRHMQTCPIYGRVAVISRCPGRERNRPLIRNSKVLKFLWKFVGYFKRRF